MTPLVVSTSWFRNWELQPKHMPLKGQIFTSKRYETHVEFNVMHKGVGHGPPASAKYVWPQKLKVNEKHMDSSLLTHISRL